MKTLPRIPLAVALFACALRTSAQSPSIVLVNGRIFTSDSARPWAEAVAIRGKRISAVGSSTEIMRLAGKSTRRIDLGGRIAIAGINDAHDHLGESHYGIDFRTSDSPTPDPTMEEVLDSLRVIAARSSAGTWLSTNIGMRIIGDTAARRAALDRVAPDHPVALFTWWGHPAVLNSAALAALQITDGSSDPLGGWYERDTHGRLTGRADEYAKQIIDRQVRSRRAADGIVAELRAYAQNAAQLGVTSVQNMTTSFDPAKTVAAFRAASLPMRVRLIGMPMPNADGRNAREWDTVRTTIAPRVLVSGRKWVLDGTPIEGNALRRTPYPNRPNDFGRANFPTDTVRAMLREALRPGAAPLHLHVVGDSMTVLVLNLMEALAPDSAWRPKRVRFEHGNGLVGEQLTRAVRKGIIIAQPRAESAPFKSWLDAGIVVAYGSDGLRNPFVHMMNAVAKPGGDSTQRVTREEWVRIMTRGSAYAERQEREKGTLTRGMLADIVVLSQDIFRVPAPALPRTRSVLTIIDGRVVVDSLPRLGR